MFIKHPIKLRTHLLLFFNLVLVLLLLNQPYTLLLAQEQGATNAQPTAPANVNGAVVPTQPVQATEGAENAASAAETQASEAVSETEANTEEVEPGKAMGRTIRAEEPEFPRRFGYDYFSGARNKILNQERAVGGRRLTTVEKDAISGFVGPIDMMDSNVSATVPAQYSLRPGDRLKIQYWSDVLELQVIEVVVDSEGKVEIPKIGPPIVVRGMTLGQFQEAVKDMIERAAYKNLKLIATLEGLKSIQIFITGESFRPGSYAVSSITTIFNALYLCGGPGRNGSLRNIKLLRNGDSQSIDFYKFLMEGDSSQDFGMEPGDTIFISPVGRIATISGEVKRPAIYELKEGDNLLELISLAGDVLPSGFLQRIQIDSVRPGKERILLNVDLSDDKRENPIIFDGDSVQVFSIPSEYLNTVSIEGKVRMPGTYELKEGMTVSDLIKAAQWLLGEAYTERADLLRLNPDRRTTKLIPVNLSKALAGDLVHNVVLSQWDRLIVYSKMEVQWTPRQRVGVRGAVQNPGFYDKPDGMTVGDLLMRAGGTIPEAYLDKAFLLRIDENGERTQSIPVNLKGPGSDVELRDDDTLVVYREREVKWIPRREVIIRGAVQKPSAYLRVDGMKVMDLVQIAGGLLPDAYPDRALLLRLNNRREITQGFFISPKLALRDDPKNNLELLDGDMLTIYTYKEAVWEPERKVTIMGAVNNPGSFIIADSPGVASVGGADRPSVIKLPTVLRAEKPESPFVIGELETIRPEIQSPFAPGAQELESEIIAKEGNETKEEEEPPVIKRAGIFERVDGMRVSDLILRAGGLLPNAYLERAELRRFRSDYETFITIPVNLANAIAGNKEADILLQDGDFLTIYTISEVLYRPKNIVIMYGAVQRPDIYTRTIGMKLSDLLFMAGGLLPGALKDAEITRISDVGKTYTHTVDVVALLAGDESQDILLEDEDVISIRKDNEFLDVLRTAEINGEVKYPGRYALKQGERLSDLIKRAGGITSRAYPEAAVITRSISYLVLDEQKKSATQVKALLSELSQQEYQREVARAQLAEERRIRSYNEQANLAIPASSIVASVTGAVASIPEQTEAAISNIEQITQQMYTLVTPAREIASFLPPGRLVVNVREAIDNSGKKDDIILENGDKIVIPPLLDTISVTGAVIQPSSLVFIRSIKPKTVKDYIEMVGGYSRDADIEAVYVVKANGMVVRGNKAELDPGDMIVVPTKIMIQKITDRWGQVISAVKFTVTTLALLYTIRLILGKL